MSDEDILENYVDLEQSFLSESEKKEVMDILYKIKDTFSLKHEIGTCPSIKVEIDITDKPLFPLEHNTLKRMIKLF